MPINKKQEVLIIDGRTKDEKESSFVMYRIIIQRSEDDSSQILRFEKITDSAKPTWRAELILKRKWFASVNEVIAKELATGAEDPLHEVYFCELGTKRKDKSINRSIFVIHRDYAAQLLLYGVL
jgi:hypothetical protein